MCLQWRLGVVYRWNFSTGAFLAENLSVLGQIFDFGGIFWGLDINFEFRFPKSLTLAWDRVVWAIVRENLLTGLTCRSVNKKGIYISEKNFRYISPICREAPNGRICTKFCTGGQLADAITCFKFCVNRLRGFGSARSRILPFFLYLAGRH